MTSHARFQLHLESHAVGSECSVNYVRACFEVRETSRYCCLEVKTLPINGTPYSEKYTLIRSHVPSHPAPATARVFSIQLLISLIIQLYNIHTIKTNVYVLSKKIKIYYVQ